MIEKFTRSKLIETKEATIKRLAREMLERFRAKFKTEEKVGHVKELTPPLEPVATEDVKITDKEDRVVVVEPQQPEESEMAKPSVRETKTEVKPAKKERKRKTDKGVFESAATNNYFEGWDEDVELKGNPEIKKQIRENIIRAEKANQQKYQDAASGLGISVEEFKDRLQAKVEDMVERANFFRATQPDVLEKIINVDGRWKSQFETGTSQGTLDPGFRAVSEIKMFGFNKDMISEMPKSRYGEELPPEVITREKEKRPIYGYFSDEENGAINNVGKIPPPTNVQWYGTVNVKIKKERALDKATLTFHDSLDPADNWPPTPASRPHFTSFRLGYYGGDVLNKLKGPSVVNWGESYTEVQFHGQLTMDDVESIHVSTHNGLHSEDIERVRRIFRKYKEQHPESTIELIEF